MSCRRRDIGVEETVPLAHCRFVDQVAAIGTDDTRILGKGGIVRRCLYKTLVTLVDQLQARENHEKLLDTLLIQSSKSDLADRRKDKTLKQRSIGFITGNKVLHSVLALYKAQVDLEFKKAAEVS